MKHNHPNSLLEKMAKALHTHGHYGNARSWDELSEEVLEYMKKTGFHPNYMTEASKEEWRFMAARFINEICPKFGIEFSVLLRPEEGKANEES